MWTSSERKFLRSLSSPQKIQNYLDSLIFNPEDACLSPRYVMMSGDAHCFESCLLAASALELQGHPPLIVDLMAVNDDDHTICVYKSKTGWGSISKSNTTLLAGRDPFYRTIRELVMSYFPFYFNSDGKLTLYAYSEPISLNHYNLWNWRTTDENLEEMGKSLSDETHFEIISHAKLFSLPKVHERLVKACFLGADPKGFFKIS